MFAFRSRKEIAIHVSMVAVVLFNSFAPSSALASSEKGKINQDAMPQTSHGLVVGKKSSTISSHIPSFSSGMSNTITANSPELQSSNQCVLPPAGLIDWWTAEGNANDVIGGHHGTLNGGVTFVPGMVGQAFSFDGINDSVSLGNWFTMQDFTVTMWVKAGATQQTYANIIDNNHSDVNWVI
jgi:hypothetical protein